MRVAHWLALVLLLSPLLVVALLIGGLLLLPLILFPDTAAGHGNTSEWKLIAIYQAHPEVPPRLRELCRADWRQRWYVGDEEASAAEGYAEFARLCGLLGAYGAEVRAEGNDCDFEIRMAWYGNFFRAQSWSFVFTRSGVPPPDILPRPNSDTYEHHRPLGNGWFLRYRFD